MKHKHHIIPRHMGGTNDEENIIELSIEEHAEAHKLLYEKYGNTEDFLAWKGLAGQITKEEILTEIYRLNGKRLGESRKGKPAHNKGIPMSEEQKEKLRKPKTEEHKQNLRKPKNNKENMGKHERSDISRKASSERFTKLFTDPDIKRRLAEGQEKSKKPCVHCGKMVNAGNMKRHATACGNKI